MKKITIIIAFVFCTVITTNATTWFTIKVKCPVCETINDFKGIGSYGSYIKDWPEKLEYIFWPETDFYSVYTCSNCKYTAFMNDFSEIGKDTIELIKKELPNLNLKVEDYWDDMIYKLPAAEKIYKLYKHDPDFWCTFYRLEGYHFQDEGKLLKAKKARLKALSIADSLVNLSENVNRQKELLLITGSMKYFTNQKKSAIKYINQALTLSQIDLEKDSIRNALTNKYLDGILNELRCKILKIDPFE
jgi:phage FluMu protein Com